MTYPLVIRRRFFLTLLVILTGYAAFAQTLPADLLYNGKPIEPYCLEGLVKDNDGSFIDLQQCNAAQISLEKGNPMEEKNTFNAYWSRKDEPPELFLHYSLGYDYIGRQDGDPILHIGYWAGGSGSFSYLVKVHREGNQLKLMETLASGDGCTGGIISKDSEHPLAVENDEVRYSALFSPADMIRIAGDDDWYSLYSRQGGLAGTHHDCYGIANYDDGKLVSVEFSGYIVSGLGNKEKPPSKPDLQYCMDQWIDKNYIAQNKLIITVSELHKLISDFRKQCVTAP